MSLPRYAAARDENESEVVAELRKVGATVVLLSQKGVPDLLVGYRGRNFLLECKSESRSAALTPAQIDFIQTWRGEVCVVTTPEQALVAITR